MDPKCLDLIESQFVDAFNGLQELHDGGQLDECINGANSLLQDVAVPRYVRMKTLMLLADSVQDWKEAEGHRSQAEVLWQIERVCYVQGDNKVVDEVLDNLRVDLNELCAELGKKRRPVASQEMFDAKYATERHMAAHKEAVKKYEETVDDEDELERIDLEILGMTREQSLAILDRKAAKNNNPPLVPIDAPSTADQDTPPFANLEAPPNVDPDIPSVVDLDTGTENVEAD